MEAIAVTSELTRVELAGMNFGAARHYAEQSALILTSDGDLCHDIV